jgi:hypothetical protein
MMTNEEWTSIHQAAAEEARQIVKDHADTCPFTKLQIEQRVRTVELRFTTLIGFMAGSGLLGGVAGGAIFKALGH